MTDAGVIIVGAGPAGLMLAGELRLAGVRPLVLERRTQPGETPKAGGLGGQILYLLRYRGLLERFEAASTDPRPAPRFPFGGLHLDFTHLADPPMHALRLPQARLERLLDERARGFGADIRRGRAARRALPLVRHTLMLHRVDCGSSRARTYQLPASPGLACGASPK